MTFTIRDLWLGPLPGDIHYNKELNPPISLNPPKYEEIWGAWRWYKEMDGGLQTKPPQPCQMLKAFS